MARRNDTRQRLLEAGMALFAERGFGATSVADIEGAVGLQPRRGGLYKHFASKHDLLETAVREHLADAESLARAVGELDFTNVEMTADGLRPIVGALARMFLAEMDRLEALTRVLEHDGGRLGALTSEVKARAVDLSYRAAAGLIAAVAPWIEDPDATSVVFLAPLVALRRTIWTFGAAPLDLDDDRFLRAWVSAVVIALIPEAVGGRSVR
jgi:AcrR family transcriptional regulator